MSILQRIKCPRCGHVVEYRSVKHFIYLMRQANDILCSQCGYKYSSKANMLFYIIGFCLFFLIAFYLFDGLFYIIRIF